MDISIIVPALREGPLLGPFLEHLRERAPGAEIIVACGNDSATPGNITAAEADRVVTSESGRAVQMNAGAAVARGDVFWFVHADCLVPERCLDGIANVLGDPRIVVGCFRIQFPQRELIYRVGDFGGNLAVDLFGRCYGDHGIFCRRRDFIDIGGYPNVPLLEDAEFYRRLRRRGRTCQIPSKIVASARRYQEIGPYRLTVAYTLISTMYLLGVPIWLLAGIYQRLCR